ncbi:hypothetical protein C173_10021 [Paenibacillus sp. FSL R7-277]|uniref:SMODS domain-containing nucleotidyltransferase n=1 Tax=Paenibacillus sp. FSL R7-277 TaxID=1227352 RepID=UPI0003E2694B|nr:nucleotidyltransferase [Paenibacillus sp. FSL R7-277]ETT74128.1 hypothetical protein C173_10021 [Paenibacillus sp. FSL R7-277]
MITQAQFISFLRNIEPSPTTKSNASDGHIKLRNYLHGHFAYKQKYVNSFLTGSYKRDTAIRPKIVEGETARPDVDIIVVTNHTRSHNPQEVITILYDALKPAYPTIRPQNRSVGIKTDKVDIDVVPIIAPYGMEGTLYIPDRKKVQWIETNPPNHTSWTTEVNQGSGERFKPLVKLMKWWRRENGTNAKKPKGFVIECIVAECMDRNQTQYGELFVGTLERIVDKYAISIALKVVPVIQDPGVSFNSVTNGMTFEAFERFYNKVKLHAIIGREAINELDAEKSLQKWRVLFGGQFPKSGMTQTNSLIASAISPSLSFPNHAVEPKKPEGFA